MHRIFILKYGTKFSFEYTTFLFGFLEHRACIDGLLTEQRIILRINRVEAELDLSQIIVNFIGHLCTQAIFLSYSNSAARVQRSN
jgi:hypothetical protein